MTSPTTPRDDIGMSERLHAAFIRSGRYLFEEAATQLDAYRSEISDWANEVARYKTYAEKFEQENAALSARVKELEAEVERNDFNLMTKADAAEARAELAESRATRLQQQRDMLQFELDTSNDNHRAMARQLADMGQQRDEAYARAATIAHDIKNRCIVESTNPDRPRVQQMASSAQAFTASEIAAAIRRLAAGDEEGK